MFRLTKFILPMLLIATVAYAQPIDLKTVINEGDTAYLTLKFVDQNGNTIPIDSLQWWVDDEASNQNQIPAQTLPTPTASPIAEVHTLIINNCASAMISNRSSENKLVTVSYTYGGSGQYQGNDYARYKVKNIPNLGVGGLYPNCGITPIVRTPTPTPTP